MSKFLCLTVRFLQPLAHGRGDGGEPEWPPSPLRLFQALVAASAARWNERLRLEYAVPALEWLATQPAPAVVAAVGVKSDVKYRLYVPDNVGDKVAKSWAGGNVTASIADYRTEKDVRPTHLAGDAVHYLYTVADADGEFAKHKETLVAAARSITHLGWGVDMVAGNAAEMTEEEVAKLAGERWEPTKDASATELRVPRAGTLRALMDKHTAFLNRLSGEGFKPVPPLTAFGTVGYRRDTDPAGRPFAAFRIASVDPDAPNPSFDTPRHCAHVAAWVRHATGQACAGWRFGDPAPFVHGHASSTDSQPLRGEGADDRFMYLPLPSVERRGDRGEHVGAIRRVLVAAPPGRAERVEWVRRRLAGRELVWDNMVHGLLADLPGSDWVLGRYTGEARVWSTVTPVVLPGYDDPTHVRRRLRANRESAAPSAAVQRELLNELEDGVRGALLRAFEYAGLAALVEPDQLGWRNVGFLPGVEPASAFARDGHHRRFSVYHVRVRFARPVRGPLAVGAGRYRGLGLFASVEG